jgi:hypothetical protein
LKSIEQEQRHATSDEQQALARFAGFGPVALSIFPDPATGRYKDAGWQAIGEELKTLLTAEEYDSAKRTTFNAFYTSPTVIGAIHEAISRLGVPGNATVLEPGCGTGNFMSQGKKGMRFIGVELDSISGRIAKARHPGQDIRIESFRDTKLPEDRIDAVIGNVPFADLKLDYHGQKLSLHDYFFAKSVDALKPGGVLALVTTHFTLDKQNAEIREYLGSKADFVGAIRLPSDAFKREGTAVVTDIIFLRKRAPGDHARHEEAEWQRARPMEIDGMEVPINRYFVRHPEMVLGTWSRKDTLYGGEGYSVISNGDLAQKLGEAIQRLPQFAPIQPSLAMEPAAEAFAPPPPERHITEGSFFVADDRRICQSVGVQAVPVVYGGTTLRADGTMTGKRLAALIGLRDKARRVLQSQNEGWPDANRQDTRRELGWAYSRFVTTYGPINKTTFGETADGNVIRRMPNLVKFKEDPDAMLVMSLEEYDEVTGKAAKATIMTKDVVGKTPPTTHVKSAEEGLLVSLNQRGTVDIAYIAALYGKPEEQVISELGDLIFRDPASNSWETADAYLSGNVRAKLAAAEHAGPAYAANADTLRAVQPEDMLPGDIDAGLGAPWIPVGDIQAFAAELFHVEPSSVPVAHLQKDAVWNLDADYAAEKSVAATSEFGTARQRHLAVRPRPEYENPRDLRHDRSRRPRGKGGEPRGDACRPRKAKAHQGAFSFVGVHRPAPHRAAGAALQRHLQQSASPSVRRLPPRLPRHESEYQTAATPGRRRVARHEFRQHAFGPRRWRRQDLHDGRHRHEDEAGRSYQEADVRRSQPLAGAILPRVHAALSQCQTTGRRQGRFNSRPSQVLDRQDRQRRVGRHHRHP